MMNLRTINLGIFTLSPDDFIMTIKLPLWKVLSLRLMSNRFFKATVNRFLCIHTIITKAFQQRFNVHIDGRTWVIMQKVGDACPILMSIMNQ